MTLHREINSRVVPVVVAHVVDGRIVIRQQLKRFWVVLIVDYPERVRNLPVAGVETIDEKIDVKIASQVHQQLFTVVGNSGLLWIEWTEIRNLQTRPRLSAADFIRA